MAASEVDTETQLITYVKNILKYQIIPMDCMNLRNLVKEAPQNMKLFEYIEQNYPDTQFLEFLKKYPHIFTLNSNCTVILAEENSFTLPYATPAKYSDQVDGCNPADVRDRAEYVSDSDSDSSGAEDDRLLKKERPKRAADRFDSTSSESSIELFSSEMVHTSDSDHSSLTSSSSSED